MTRARRELVSLDAGGEDSVRALSDRLERGLIEFHRLCPAVPATVNYAHVPVEAMSAIPPSVDVLVFHPYIYGVLQALIDTYGLRGTNEDFDQRAARTDLLRPGAPDLTEWVLPAEDAWRLEASIIAKPEMYVHDWCDPAAFDRWLYDHYGAWREEMATKLTLWLEVAADTARARGVPLAFGEGWVGYTPLHGTFEEGPVGAELCRRAVAESARVGAWGTIVCSNAAPQHPMWADVALQVECNDLFTRNASPPA